MLKKFAVAAAIVAPAALGLAVPATAIAQPTTAQACGYWVSNGTGFITNCRGVRTLANWTYFSDAAQVHHVCLNPGGTELIGADSSIRSAWLGGNC